MKRDPRFLGLAVTLLRERCGKAKSRVAREAEIRRSHLLSYERGEAVPRPETLARLAEALGTTVERIETMADALAAAPGLLEPAGPSDLEAALLPPLPANPREERADPDTAEALWLRLRPYTASQRRAIVLETPEFHRRALSERLQAEAKLDEAAARDLVDLASLVARLAPVPAPP
jgi:transcriptional regulator with XRE-family HTH domain